MVRTMFRTIRLGLIAAFMATALASCAAKTQEVEVLLWRVDPETARYFLGASDIASAASEN